MPTYTFLNSITKEVEEYILKISELDKFKIDNPHLERCFQGEAPALGDSVRLGIRKIDDGFRDVLRRVHENQPGSILKDNIR